MIKRLSNFNTNIRTISGKPLPRSPTTSGIISNKKRHAYSESLFRTVNYHPSWPSEGFKSLDEVRQWLKKFVN